MFISKEIEIAQKSACVSGAVKQETHYFHENVICLLDKGRFNLTYVFETAEVGGCATYSILRRTTYIYIAYTRTFHSTVPCTKVGDL